MAHEELLRRARIVNLQNIVKISWIGSLDMYDIYQLQDQSARLQWIPGFKRRGRPRNKLIKIYTVSKKNWSANINMTSLYQFTTH